MDTLNPITRDGYGSGAPPGTRTATAHQEYDYIRHLAEPQLRFLDHLRRTRPQAVSRPHDVPRPGPEPSPATDQQPRPAEPPCCCCANSIRITDISEIDTATTLGHRFRTEFLMNHSGTGLKRDCTLLWEEYSTQPYGHGAARLPANTWTNLLPIMPASFSGWQTRPNPCPAPTPVLVTVQDHDAPSIPKSELSMRRLLRFRITLNSGSGCACEQPSRQVTAAQTLHLYGGQTVEKRFQTPDPQA